MNVATKAEQISAMWFFWKACCIHIIMNHQRKNLIVLKCNVMDRKYLQSLSQPVPTLLFNIQIKKPLARFTCYRNAVYLTYHIHVTQRCVFFKFNSSDKIPIYTHQEMLLPHKFKWQVMFNFSAPLWTRVLFINSPKHFRNFHSRSHPWDFVNYSLWAKYLGVYYRNLSMNKFRLFFWSVTSYNF